jgi:putative transposase
MSRPLRIEVEGGWYHVISRGIERREIFGDDSDRRDFLERLFALSDSHEVRVHAYCLMTNHFHLQLETPRANLKDTMQRALSGYVVRFNLRHHRAGPLFQGRYRAILAGEPDWICEVNRYIHLNPVRLESLDLGKQRQAEIRRGVEEPAPEAVVRKRLELLRAYPWSSYRAYAGYITGPAQLQKEEVLDCFEGRTQQQRRKSFRDYTESAIREGIENDELLEHIRYGVLLGSQEWTAKMRHLLEGDRREQPALEAIRREAIGFELVAAAVAEEFGEHWDDLKNRRGHPARSLAIVLCRRHTALKLNEIGERCGGSDYAAVSQAQHRMETKLRNDPRLTAIANRVTKRLMSYPKT